MAGVRGDEWLPEGWKVEVRVRKSGRKDRYYTDPASGYVFRSLKDIDRYLITGKFGRHSVKSKQNDVAGGEDPLLDAEEAPVKVLALKEDSSKGKRSKASNESKKGVQKQNSGRNAKKKPATGAINSNQQPKNRKIFNNSPHKKSSDNFFILDSDQDATNELGLPNFPEIVDSVRDSKDNANAAYLSAPEIALLLGRQMPNENPSNWDHHEYPKPLVAASSHGEEKECTHVKTDTKLDSPLTLSWGEICSDPCIEFAIKTLTGAIPLECASDGKNTATNQECPDLVHGNN